MIPSLPRKTPDGPLRTSIGGALRRWLGLAAPLRLPLAAYLASRLVVWAAAVFTITLHTRAAPSLRVSWLLGSWDGAWYRSIVEHGYPSQLAETGGQAVQSSLAFFPLYPLSVKLAQGLVNFRLSTTLVFVALLFGAIAVCLLWQTARILFDEKTADRAAFLFSFFPGAFVFSFAYAEGLMLSLALVSLAALHRRRWVTAGVAGALATATRPNAIVLVACAVWAAWTAIRERRDYRSLLAPALTPLGALVFLGYVAVHTGDAGAWWRVQREGWGQRFDAGYRVGNDVIRFVLGYRHDLDHLILFGGVVTVAIGLVLLFRARLPAIYTIYAIGVLALALGSENLGARPRFVLTAFPLAIAAARTFGPNVVWALTGCGAGLMTLLVVWYLMAPPGAVPP